jgi:hypothetical protein
MAAAAIIVNIAFFILANIVKRMVFSGKVQFHAVDLTGISASQVLPAGKVSPVKLDLTRNLVKMSASARTA